MRDSPVHDIAPKASRTPNLLARSIHFGTEAHPCGDLAPLIKCQLDSAPLGEGGCREPLKLSSSFTHEPSNGMRCDAASLRGGARIRNAEARRRLPGGAPPAPRGCRDLSVSARWQYLLLHCPAAIHKQSPAACRIRRADRSGARTGCRHGRQSASLTAVRRSLWVSVCLSQPSSLPRSCHHRRRTPVRTDTHRDLWAR
jgi:hypothetical protein